MAPIRPWDELSRLTPERPWDEEAWGKAIEERKVVVEPLGGGDGGRVYYRFEKDAQDLARGTVLCEEGLLHEYPHLPRVLHLRRGLARAFGDAPFRLEEKVDGYNVRVARVGGEVLAFSRGGFVCPFATDRLADFPEVPRFVERHPRLVLCVEVAGPGNPYNLEHPPYVAADVRAFAFDVMEVDTGRFLPPDEKDRLLASEGVPSLRTFGRFTAADADAVWRIVRDLDEAGCEGVVMKPDSAWGPGADAAAIPVKYVGFGACVRDLAVSANLLGAVPRAFIINRLVQAAFVLDEQYGGRATDEDALRLGRVLLEPIGRSVRDVEARGEVEERYVVRLREERSADRLVRHLDHSSATVQIKVLERVREPETGRVRLTFLKRYQKATGFFLSRLQGTQIVD